MDLNKTTIFSALSCAKLTLLRDFFLPLQTQRFDAVMRAESDAHDCGACDKPNSADVGMVACDGCSVWYHYTCAKVSPGVQQRSWRCCKCPPEMHPEVTGAKKKGGKKQPASLTVLGAASSENPKSNNASQKKTSEKSKNSEKSRTLVVPNLAASDNTTP